MKLELHKRYNLRDGRFVDILQKQTPKKRSRFTLIEASFIGAVDGIYLETFKEGGHYINSNVQHPMDIVSTTS